MTRPPPGLVLLHEGETARVLTGQVPGLGEVVVKVARDDAAARRLADEAERLVLGQGAALPVVLGVGIGGTEGTGLGPGRGWLLLRRAPGLPAAEAAASGRLSRERLALVVARDAGLALSRLHAAGVSHGDVKPDNVVVDLATPAAVLVDLGLASTLDVATPVGGTPRYLAPESFARGHAAGAAAARDLWALGVTIAELADDRARTAADLRTGFEAASLPPAIARIVTPLLEASPALRPPASWVSATARAELGGPAAPRDEALARAEVEEAFVHAHRGALELAARGTRVTVRVAGEPGRWLARRIALLERIAELRGARLRGPAHAVVDLDALGRARVLVALVGAPAARFPAASGDGDAGLAERLIRAAARRDPRSLGPGDLEAPRPADESVPADPVELALALAGGEATEDVLGAAERAAGTPEGAALRLPLGRVLGRRGETGRAVALLAGERSATARVELAELARRAGDAERALAELAALRDAPGAGEGRVRVRAAAIEARIRLDAGDPTRARALLVGAPRAAPTLEVLAQLELAAGDAPMAARAADEGLAVATDVESRSRLVALRAYVAHALGDSSRASRDFREASELALRAGALLEEATYLTGVAAASLDAGEIADSLAASTRAALLFEHLGRPPLAARALLDRAAALAAAGGGAAAREAGLEAIHRARRVGDDRCRAYGHLVVADAAAPGDPDAVEHAARAAALLAGSPSGDWLRAAARLLCHGGTVSEGEGDAAAAAPGTALAARLEWWGERAARLAERPAGERADHVLAALAALADERGPLAARARAFGAGARLAAKVGDGALARRLVVAAGEASRRLLAGAPPELRGGLAARDADRALPSTGDPDLSPPQLAELDGLVRSLGERERLSVLLDRIVDAMLLWTGVERGLLLLRAGDRLVPRAARNLARRDLEPEQLALSRTLAERALSTGEPVVAVDAAGELPEVHRSVHLLRLRSVLAVPLVARGEALGVVYLDDRVRRGAFGPGALAWVRLLATVAAVAIADARAQLLLRRAVRSARRAEARAELARASSEARREVAAAELARARAGRATRYPYDDIVGDGPRVRALLALLDRVVPTDVPVLVTGESGTGKELVARALHAHGPRSSGPFVSENCAAIPEPLLESVLFGHMRGAFTGATHHRVGLFEAASGGTLFLDEIGEMPVSMQAKLLRVLSTGRVRPVGGERERAVDVRIVTATHRDLRARVASGAFREDLLYRLEVIHLEVPPLRERAEDIPALVRHFLGLHAAGRDVVVTPRALALLARFPFPGNVRQLENELRRALVLADRFVDVEHLSPEVRAAGGDAPPDAAPLDLRARTAALERDLVRKALEECGGNQTRAARALGVSRFGLQKMLRRLGLSARD